MAGILGRLRSVLSARTVAQQVFVLQAAIVVLLVVATVVAVVLQVQTDSTREARNRSLAVAETFAHSPGIAQAMTGPDPAKELQPRAEAARKASGVDFIVAMSTEGVRYTHPDPGQIGEHYQGTIGPAARGGTVQETYTGSLGPSVRAAVPVRAPDGRIVGLVAAGVRVSEVSGVVQHQLPLLFGSAAAVLALGTAGTFLISRRLRQQTHGLAPVEMTRIYEHHDAVLHAVREGVLIMDGQGRLALANDEARRLLGLPADAEGRKALDLGIAGDMARLFASGRFATDEIHLARGRLLAVSQRPTERDGGAQGSVATLRDTTELRALTGRADQAQERLRLLYDAGLEVGTGLDVARTAGELVEVAVPRFADYATVDLAVPVLRGGEPQEGNGDMQRVALGGVSDDCPLYGLGEVIRFDPATPQASGFGEGQTVLDEDLPGMSGWQLQDPERARRILASGMHSMLATPVHARGVIMGVVTFWRAGSRAPFEAEDVSLAEELVARAGVSIDNARRYTREHNMAVTLQRSLLPRAMPDQSALDVAYGYLPAQASPGGVGGDWFDVIPLPGARVALVVGDVVGHGLYAAATMGRLRTAVHNFSALDVPPDELLWHLDQLVTRIDEDESDGSEGPPVTGATCLYAVYDPGTGLCTLARAGHLEPAVVHPDGTVEFLDVPGGPPLGLGGRLPVETAQLILAEGSSLVFYTDGLVEDHERDIDEGLELLRQTLDQPHRTPEAVVKAVLEALVPERPRDDVALVVARTRMLAADHTAVWDVPADDPSAVGRIRAAASRTLENWGLTDVAFTTELILSELVTNAIRHAGGPIRVRLIRDRALICEVSDGSSTAPHLRRAATEDEGGRGLFLVAQFADRWGTRYTAQGKVIWTEQPLTGVGEAALAAAFEL
ncbi:SpoIIE family protein phosphatase [Streptomyces sp. NPDC086787]|uniref:SpoIIE family protein phosphatase n=1 Tax=Streptomyces sp. NPDC086787 TaxID=3365759 RepID=UPI0037F7C2F5